MTLELSDEVPLLVCTYGTFHSKFDSSVKGHKYSSSLTQRDSFDSLLAST